MAVYFDTDTNKYYCNFRYRNYLGELKGTTKRGFETYEEAEKWELNFKENNHGLSSLSFKEFTKVYLEDSTNRIALSTLENRKYIIKARLVPYFKDKKLDKIKPLHIREWQNDILKEKLSGSYLRSINMILNDIFNLAHIMFGIENPCDKIKYIGKIGSKRYPVMSPTEFKNLIEITDDSLSKLVFTTLYFTGIRIGELLALRKDDIDFKENFININKNLVTINGKKYVKEPKTKNSIRVINIPNDLSCQLFTYAKELKHYERIFNTNTTYLHKHLKKGCSLLNRSKLRLHDFRHAHASYLIHIGTNLIDVSNRLGHSSLYITLRTYAHYIPEINNSISNDLELLWSELK